MGTEKHLKLTGSSEVSWKDAIVKTIEGASKTVDYLTSVTVLEQKARIDGNKIVEYFATIDLGFNIDSSRGWFILKPINTNKEYQTYVDKKSPNSPILKNCFNSFWVGGLICVIGQIILEICKYRGLELEMSYTIVSISLIFVSAFLTSLNLFNKIGKFAGAGSLVPITGFANSIVSPAMEYKSEGYVMGVGGKMFTVAGPVLVFGISTSILVGLVYLIFNTQSITLV